MRLKVVRIGSDPTVRFAQEELCRFLRKMDKSLRISQFVCATLEEYLQSPTDAILIGSGLQIDEAFDDQIHIAVRCGNGVISGANPRSVLFAVYRFLYELGCRYPDPNPDGDIVPSRTLTPADLNVSVTESPFYRHRGICLEGSVDYQIVENWIGWMPKIGLNSFFIQYLHPKQFFSRICKHYGEDISIAEVDQICSRLVEEIKKRDLLYHAVGHGWQCDPFGIPGDTYGVRKDSVPIPEKTKPLLALVNGKRELFHNNPLETNLCYSDPEVRRIMLSAITDYCKKHPEVDYIHFWLSDGTNSLCECEQCRNQIPADLYIQMLNELDAQMTAEHLNTKIVFLCYSDLMWAPVKEHLINPNRFTFMATIPHSYSKPIDRFDHVPEVPPFRLNRNAIPQCNEESITMVRAWQEVFSGDSFLYEYNQVWDHYKDPGYMQCAERIHGDIRALKNLGLNGIHSCQFLQAGFPTWLPSYTFGAALWNPSRTFSSISDEYFTAVFGSTAEMAKSWLAMLSQRFDPQYLRNELLSLAPLYAERYAELRDDITHMLPKLKELSKHVSAWKKLYQHAQLSEQLAELLRMRAAGEDCREKMRVWKTAAYAIYDETLGFFDVKMYTDILSGFLTDSSTDFAREVAASQK